MNRWLNVLRASWVLSILLAIVSASCGGVEGDVPVNEDGTARLDEGSNVDAGDSDHDAGTVADSGTHDDMPVDAGADGSTVELMDAGAATCTDTWTSYAKGFFANTCVGCHSWASSTTSVNSRLSRIRSELSSGGMPKGMRLPADEKARIIDWIDCGAKQ